MTITTTNDVEQETASQLQLLNRYRLTELHSVATIMRMARLADSPSLRAALSHQMRDEAAHSWLWTKAIGEHPQGEVIAVNTPYTERLGLHYGIPRTLTEMLALAWVSRKRSIAEYTEHLHAPDVSPRIKRLLRGILRDESRHVRHINDELQRRMEEDRHVRDIVDRALAADQQSVAELASFTQLG
jgi:hypothetical protein